MCILFNGWGTNTKLCIFTHFRAVYLWTEDVLLEEDVCVKGLTTQNWVFPPLNCVMLIMWHWGRIWYCIVSIVYSASHDPWLVIFPSIILRICCWPLKRRKSIENVFFTQTQISGPTPSKTNQARVDNGHGRVCFIKTLKTTNNFWFQSGRADKLQRRNNICTLWAKVTWEAGDKCKQMTK